MKAGAFALSLAACAGVGGAVGCTQPAAEDGAYAGESGNSDASSTDTGGEAVPRAGPRGLLVAQDWGHAAYPTSAGAGAGEYHTILLQESMHSILTDIRAANPSAKLLAYQKVGGMRSDGDDHPSTGVQIGEAAESWFLHDSDGKRLAYCDYAGVYAANIGDPDYQSRWLENVRTRVPADGFDGVMMDDANTFPGHCLGSKGTAIAEYPTDEAYGDALVAFMGAVGPGLIADGLLVAPNIAMNPWDDTMLAQSQALLPYITHWLREYWMRWDDSENFRGDNWVSTLETMRIAQDAGVAYLAITYGPGYEGADEGQWYGRASWLLAWDGVSDSGWGYFGADGADPWAESWGPDIGLPLDEAVEYGPVWYRRYSGGIVVVNPSEEDGVVVPLGETYVDPVLGEVDMITLDRGHARVLATP